MKTRGILYFLARLMGDYQAISRGRIGKRIVRRVAGRMTGKMLRALFR